MPRNGSGTYTLPSGNPVVSGTVISSTVQNNTMSDVASALTASVCKDGQTAMTGNLPLGGFKITGAGTASNANEYPTVAQIQGQFGTFVSTVGGTATAITLTPSPAITAYATGQKFTYVSTYANTGPSYVNVSAISGGDTNIVKNGKVLVTTGTTSNGSAVITGLASVAGLAVNQVVAGTGVPVNSIILSIDSGTQITINKTATASGSVTLTFGRPIGEGDIKASALVTLIYDGVFFQLGNGFFDYRNENVTFRGNEIFGGTSTFEGTISLAGTAVSTTGTTVSGSKIISNIPTTENIVVGASVSGSGIPTNTLVQTVDSGTQVTLTKTSTASASGVSLTFTPQTSAINTASEITLSSSATVNVGAAASNNIYISTSSVITTGDTSNGSPTVVNIPNTSTIAVGSTVSGTGISGGTTVLSVDSSSQITLSANATATNTGVSLTFVPVSTITAFDTIAAGVTRNIRFGGVITWTYNVTSMILPSSTNITTAANDCAEVMSLGSGNWICTRYMRANGLVVASGGLTVDQTTAMGTIRFGSYAVPQNATSYIASPSHTYSASESTGITYWPAVPIRLRDLLVSVAAAPPAGQTVTVTIRKNGADTGITAQITSAGTSASDLYATTAHEVYCGPGDYFTVKVVTTATTGTMVVNCSLRALQYGTPLGGGLFFFNSATLSYGGALSYLCEPTPSASAPTGSLPLPAGIVLGQMAFGGTATSGMSLLFNQNAVGIGVERYRGVFGAAGAFVSNYVAPNVLCNIDGASNTALDIQQNSTGYYLGSVAFTPTLRSIAVNTAALVPWGAQNVPQASTYYMTGYNGSTISTTETNYKTPVKAGVIKNLYVQASAGLPAGQTATITLRKNGSDTALTCTITGTAFSANDTSHSVTVTDGDLISIKIVTSATTGTLSYNAVIDHTSS